MKKVLENVYSECSNYKKYQMNHLKQKNIHNRRNRTSNASKVGCVSVVGACLKEMYLRRIVV